MPLAARKLTASQLPINIVLSDNDALMEGRSLADANKVRVVARLSSSGTATPQPGDWEAISDIIDISADSLKINLNIAKQRSL